MFLAKLIYFLLLLSEIILTAIKILTLIAFTLFLTSVPTIGVGLFLDRIPWPVDFPLLLIIGAVATAMALFKFTIGQVRKTKNLLIAIIYNREDCLMKIQNLFERDQKLRASIECLENEFQAKKVKLDEQLKKQELAIKEANIKMAQNIEKHNNNIIKLKNNVDQELHAYALKKAIERFAGDKAIEKAALKKTGNDWDH